MPAEVTVEWTQVFVALIMVGGGVLTGRWAWSKLPKKDMGAATLATVQAAQAAVALMDDVTEARLEQLEERVTKLEEIIVEKESKIELLEAEIKRLLRWIAALTEQVHGAGKVPITLDDIEYSDGDEGAVQKRRWEPQ